MQRSIVFLVFWFVALLPVLSFATEVETKIGEIDTYYQSIDKQDVKSLIDLDKGLRHFVSTPHFIDDNIWKERYRELGLAMYHYGNWFVYNEQFLVEAHKVNPNSEWRSLTLYSEIHGVGDEYGLGVMPNIEAAYQYAREFPNGPFIAQAFLAIAGFQKDLYMVLRKKQCAGV